MHIDAWVDINFKRINIIHEEFEKVEAKRHNVDMGNVTVPHFGVHLDAETFAKLKKRLTEHNQHIDEP